MGNCIPSLLFFAGGGLVGRVRRTRLSADVPLCGWVARSASTPYLLGVALSFEWGLGFAFEDEGGAGGDVEL